MEIAAGKFNTGISWMIVRHDDNLVAKTNNVVRDTVDKNHVMTVGDARPVNSSSFDSLRPMSTRGLSTSAVVSPCFDASGSYFSMYMRTVAPTEPATIEGVIPHGTIEGGNGSSLQEGARGGGGMYLSRR